MLDYIEATEKLGLPKVYLVRLLTLSIFATLAEGAGLAMVVPIYEYVSVGGELSKLPETQHWEYLFNISKILNQDPDLRFLLLFASIAVVFRQFASFARQMVVVRSREYVTKVVRDGVFQRFMRASLVEQEKLKSGELVNILTNELTRFNSSLAGFVSLTNASVMVLIYGLILAWTSWEMTLVSILVVTISSIPLFLVHNRTVEAGKKATNANVIATKFLVERLTPSRLIRLSGTEKEEKGLMQSFTNAQVNTVLYLERLTALTAVLVEPIILGLVFFLLYISVTVFAVPMTSLVVFLMVVMRLLPVSKDVIKGRQLILGCASSTLALINMLDRLKQGAEDRGGNVVFRGLQKKVEFKEVSYNYSTSNHSAVENISLNIRAGNFTVIVGPSGSGKTTLIDLLPVLRKPNFGRIFIDGVLLSDYSLSSLRAGIAYVSQRPQLYDSTIKEHVQLGKKNCSEEDIREALYLAGADEFVARLPLGIETRLGQAGSSLSGGQRQRIDLARAIISRTSLLILDEPTNALDTETEKSFANTLKHLNAMKNTTIIMITHRLNLAQYANQVVVIRNGHLEASGTLHEARTHSSWFAEALLTDSTNHEDIAYR